MVQSAQIQDWVDAARRGDPLAASKLLAGYHPVFRARAENRMDHALRTRNDPEDILQQVYLQVIRRIEHFNGRGAEAFINWVITILDNRIIDVRRAEHRQGRDVDREQPLARGSASSSCLDLLERLYAESGTPSHLARQEEAVGALLACVSGLADAHREVIELRFLQGLSLEEVASRLRSTKPAVVARTRRALDALRTSMDRMGEFTRGP